MVSIILGAYLTLFIAEFLLDWLLSILNINHSIKHQGAVPPPFEDSVDDETYSKSVRYTLRRARFGLFQSVENRAVLLLVLFTGAAGVLDLVVASWELPAFWHSAVFLTLSTLALSLISLPSSLYSRFVIEEEFGFNTAGIRTVIMDVLKQTPIFLLLMLLLLAALYASLAWAGRYWWLLAWGLFSALQLVMMIVYPTLIAPLFNRFNPLPDGSLRDRLFALADRCGFAHQGIFLMDGSRRSRHSNAFFTGIGKFRRIVLYDTLVESLEDDALEAVLAHEIGHWKFGHIRKRLIVATALSLGLFALAGVLLEWAPLHLAFGFSTPSIHALIFLASFFTSPASSLLSPLMNFFSRRDEYQADRFAATTGTGSDAMRRALLNLGRDNLSNLAPHPAYSFWHYSHPALAERLAALRAGSTK